MQNENKTPDQIIHAIEDSLEERKGRDRRKVSVVETYLNTDLDRRKGVDRRDKQDEDD